MSTTLNILKDIEKYPVLSQAEQKQLMKEWKEDHNRRSHDKLVNCNLRLVLKIAGELIHDDNDIEDAYSAGCLGLLQAIDKFDLSRKVCITTYAYNWIAASIKQYLKTESQLVSLPLEVQTDCYRIKQAGNYLTQQLGEEPTLDDYVNYLAGAYSEEDIVDCLNIISHSYSSLDATIDSDEETTVGDLVADTNVETPEDYASRIDTHEVLLKTLRNNLSEKAVEILIAKYDLNNTGHEATLDELSQKYNCSRENIRQILKKSIDAVKNNPTAIEILNSLL